MLANAGRALVRGVQQGSRPLRTPQQMQQRRGMSGGGESAALYTHTKGRGAP